MVRMARERLHVPRCEEGGHDMTTVTTMDGTQIYYKDWGTGQPMCSTLKDQVNADLLSFIRT